MTRAQYKNNWGRGGKRAVQMFFGYKRRRRICVLRRQRSIHPFRKTHRCLCASAVKTQALDHSLIHTSAFNTKKRLVDQATNDAFRCHGWVTNTLYLNTVFYVFKKMCNLTFCVVALKDLTKNAASVTIPASSGICRYVGCYREIVTG